MSRFHYICGGCEIRLVHDEHKTIGGFLSAPRFCIVCGRPVDPDRHEWYPIEDWQVLEMKPIRDQWLANWRAKREVQGLRVANASKLKRPREMALYQQIDDVISRMEAAEAMAASLQEVDHESDQPVVAVNQ